MSTPDESITVALRIPGLWGGPDELIERLPDGHRLTNDALILPDGTRIGAGVVAADDQFAAIFRHSCRQPPTAEEQATVDRYAANVLLRGPGGSLDSARTMMQAGSAVIRAGGAGVFIDNCGLAHGGENWLAMTEDGGPDAVSFAFVGIIQDQREIWTLGMHVLGLRDLVMKRADADDDESAIIDIIRYLSASERPVDNGHIIADLNGPRFQAFAEDSPPILARSPMHNPFGRLKLVSMRDIAESN